MRFFLDSANVDEAKRVRDWGLLDGVWLSASAAQAMSVEYRRAIREIAALCDGPICVETASGDPKGMYKEARE
ncbi:MAG TPA: fructose-6-phosphate aldolase, partial [Thermoanaerobaculia bacterium]|nr:fructose-6-phosphate aldolase [Thermoanaerobaculia bacterium]